MSKQQQQPHVQVQVTFTASSELDLNEICEELSINVSNIEALNMKYCELYITLKDGRELTYSTEAYMAEPDTKYHAVADTYVNNKHIASCRNYGGKIELEETEPTIYVLMVEVKDVGWEPRFASHNHFVVTQEWDRLDRGDGSILDTRIDKVRTTRSL